jgi:hypothetical protein
MELISLAQQAGDFSVETYNEAAAGGVPIPPPQLQGIAELMQKSKLDDLSNPFGSGPPGQVAEHGSKHPALLHRKCKHFDGRRASAHVNGLLLSLMICIRTDGIHALLDLLRCIFSTFPQLSLLHCLVHLSACLYHRPKAACGWPDRQPQCLERDISAAAGGNASLPTTVDSCSICHGLHLPLVQQSRASFCRGPRGEASAATAAAAAAHALHQLGTHGVFRWPQDHAEAIADEAPHLSH